MGKAQIYFNACWGSRRDDWDNSVNFGLLGCLEPLNLLWELALACQETIFAWLGPYT